MANFLGLPLRIDFVEGGFVEGVLAAIDSDTGTLTLDNATRTQPNGRSTQLTVLVIPRAKISGLSLLSVTPNGAAQPASEALQVEQTPQATPSALRNDYLSPPKSKQNSPASSRLGRQRKQSPKAAPVNLLSGSEADESGLTLDEDTAVNAVSSSGASTGRRSRKRSDKRKSSTSTVKFASSPVQNVTTETSGYTDFDSDFDFSRGLRSFDKAQVFAEIRNADQTDPALRLHSHNRRPDRYNTKLGIHENVLDDPTEDDSPQMKARTLTIDPRADDEETVVGVATPTNSTLRTLDGTLCPALSWKQWKDALQLASIEVGPNLLQRTENGARGIADFILQKVGPKVIVILCGATSSKAGFGLRAGAHLTNKGATVFCWLTPGDTLPASLEFHLRLFSASGGRVVRSSSALPTNPDIILDALADNDNDKARKPHASEGEAALYANNLSGKVISVDLPSGVDPDTGSSVGTWYIRPAYTLALGCVKLAHRMEETVGETHIVDVGLPQSAYERGALITAWPKSLFGTAWIVEVQRT